MTKRVRNEACQPEQIHNSRDARFIGDVLLSYARKDAVDVSESVWPSADSCVYRHLTVRLVLGHWVTSWDRWDYDLTVSANSNLVRQA